MPKYEYAEVGSKCDIFLIEILFFNTARECLVYLQWELKDFGSGCQVTSMYAAAVLMETWLALSTAMQK